MAKKIPNYIKQNLQKTNLYMEKVVKLNFELEEWLEKNGIEDAFDFIGSYRESRGYEIYDAEGFLDTVSEAIEAAKQDQE